MSKTELARLPMPERLEPKKTKRSLMISVRNYFYALYNATNSQFKAMLASVGNDDAITGNRMFDRGEAVSMIQKEAARSNDEATASAKKGDIYRCIVKLMKENGLSLKLRRRDYARLTHTAPAE